MPSPAGMRLSKNYRLVYEIVREQAATGAHCVIGDLFTLARQRQPHIGLSTIYRALARLEAMALIDEVRLPGAQGAFFEPAGSAHAHFRCDHCGRVADLSYSVPRRVAIRAARQLGAEIRETRVSLHGRCASCRRGYGEAPRTPA